MGRGVTTKAVHTTPASGRRVTLPDSSTSDSIVVTRDLRHAPAQRFSAFFVPKGSGPPFGPVRAASAERALEMLLGTMPDWR